MLLNYDWRQNIFDRYGGEGGEAEKDLTSEVAEADWIATQQRVRQLLKESDDEREEMRDSSFNL